MLIRRFAAWPPRRAVFVLCLLHALALGLFSAGFLLTRIELADRNVTLPSKTYQLAAKAPVQKTVWLIIDALRWDFVSNATSKQLQHQTQTMKQLYRTCSTAVCLL